MKKTDLVEKGRQVGLEELMQVQAESYPLDALFDVPLAAALMGVRQNTVYKWICEGKITPLRAGSGIRFSKRLIETFTSRPKTERRRGKAKRGGR